jgi:arginine/lysine/ornithine decarboxylase
MWKTVTLPGEYVDIASAAGRISEEFLYLYPPGIPLIVPGEVITDELVANLDRYRDCGLEITGFTGAGMGLIKVVI